MLHTIGLAVVCIATWQLVTFLVMLVTNEREDLHWWLSCGLWLILWNGIVNLLIKIKNYLHGWRKRD